jgi:hypothetical protein
MESALNCGRCMALDIFTIGTMTEVLGMDPDKVKNWMKGKPFLFKPSLQGAGGKGTRNLYNKQDFYLLGIAHELSKAGFAGVAIGKALDAIRPRIAKMDHKTVMALWRQPGGAFRVGPAPAGSVVSHTFRVGTVLKRIDDALGA